MALEERHFLAGPVHKIVDLNEILTNSQDFKNHFNILKLKVDKDNTYRCCWISKTGRVWLRRWWCGDSEDADGDKGSYMWMYV